MEIVIVGGGIAGLTAALSLHRVGIAATIYESVTRPAPLGVGINLLPHATRELDELGLLDDLRPLGIEGETLLYLTKHGRPLWREPRGLAAGYRWPQLSVHRGELHMYLLRKTIERLGADRVRLGCALVGLDTSHDHAVARFVDRRTGQDMAPVRCDVLVGADGIHSTVRRAFHPDEGPPCFSGSTLWRAVCWRDDFFDGRTMVWAGHARQKLVAYPIRREPTSGRVLVNWIAELRGSADEAPPREDWNKAGVKGDFAPAFESWRWPGLDVPAMIDATDEIFEFPMVDRDPLPTWLFGRTVLLGDAAHPMYPVGSNGATQGIIDARALAFHLATKGIDTGLAAYEAERRPATARIVEMNRANGPDQVMEIADQRAPLAEDDLDALLPVAERQAIADAYKAVAGFSPTALNQRASYSPPD